MSRLKWAVIAGVLIAALSTGAILYYNYYPLLAASNDLSPRQTGQEGSRVEELAISESTSSNSSIVIPNPYVKELQLPKDNFPNGILVDRNGTVWTVAPKSNSLIAIKPEEQKARAYAAPDDGSDSGGDGAAFSMVWTMAEGKDGSIWFSGSGKNPLWRFDPKTAKFESIRSLSVTPIQMKIDEDSDRIWYASLSGLIGVLQKQGNEYDVQEFELEEEESFPSGIYIQNQTVWITESVAGKIMVFDISAEDEQDIDVTKTAQFPQQEMLLSPSDIIINDGSAWITEHGTSFLTEYNLETGELRRYSTALHPIQVSTLPYWLEEGLDGKGVWFNEHRGNRIAFFDFSSRTLTEYEVPTRNLRSGQIANVLTIAADPNNENRVWFTEFTEDKVGYVDKSVPIPFDIEILDAQAVVGEGETAQIDIEITRNPEVQLFNNTLSFKISSSAMRTGALLNATASFSPSLVDLSEINGTKAVTLELRNEGMPQGNHLLAVSATDGAVIRTVYVDLVVVVGR